MNIDEEIRRFFGEQSEPISAPEPDPQPRPRAASYEQRRQEFIAAGECPMPACHEPLDEDACPRCGWSLIEEQLRERIATLEDAPEWLPRLPLALTLDEYGPAVVDEEDAA